MSRRVGVDLREGQYIVGVFSQTTQRIWVLDGTPALFPGDSSAERLGLAVRTALARSRTGLPGITRDSKPGQPRLDLLGLPDFATYMTGTRSVEVHSESNEAGEIVIEVTPRRNEGPRGGFTSIAEEERTFVYESAEQLGTAVIDAFTKTVDRVERLVNVGLRGDWYVMTVYSKTIDDEWVLDATPTALVVGTPADELGGEVEEALLSSRFHVQDLTQNGEAVQALLDLLELPDYAAFLDGVRSVAVFSDGDTIEVTPQRNGGPDGFTTIDAAKQTVAWMSPKQLGTAVMAALTKAV